MYTIGTLKKAKCTFVSWSLLEHGCFLEQTTFIPKITQVSNLVDGSHYYIEKLFVVLLVIKLKWILNYLRMNILDTTWINYKFSKYWKEVCLETTIDSHELWGYILGKSIEWLVLERGWN